MVSRTKPVWQIAIGVWLLGTLCGLAVLAAPPRVSWPGIRAQKKEKPKQRTEDEDDTPAARPGVTQIDDPDEKTTKAKPQSAGNLDQAARDTRHPRAKALLSRLALAHDEVVLKPTPGSVNGVKLEGKYRITPLAEFFEITDDIKGSIELKILNSEDKVNREATVSRRRLSAVHFYEQIAVDAVTEFLEQPFGRYDPSNVLYLGRLDQIVVAETALSGALQMHQSMIEREVRKGPGWDKLEIALRKQLLNVKLMQLQLLIDAKSWDAAFDLAGLLAETFDRPTEHALIAGPLGELLKKAIKDSDYTQDRLRKVRQRLRQVEDQFPGSDLVKPINASLREQAKALFDRAKELVEAKKMAEATDLLKQAEDTWPDLPGLAGYRLQVQGTYQILKVGMRDLPKYLSPGWAWTDAERHASELLFESLVQLTPDERGTLYYRPALAEGRPQVIGLGRQFKLPRQAKWSDGKPVTMGDLSFTIKLLREGRGSERNPAWGELIDRLQVQGDPFRFKFRLRQGLLDPCSAMSFKVLPARSKPHPASEEFATTPIGSGPFLYKGRLSDFGRTYSAFVANPHYSARPDSGSKPHIRELRIYAPPDPLKEISEDRLDMLVDLTPEQALTLQTAAGVEVKWPTPKTLNRRIYFLAINHRKPALANADLRIALGRAINREALLDEYFRKGLLHKVHHSLNGPYPVGSWACNPLLVPKDDAASLDPFDAELARTKLRQALTKLNQREVALTLKYPSGDRALAAAMVQLCEQVNKTLPGVKLTPVERTPHELREDVEQTFSYELAYYRYDFPDEAYWLQPLLGPTGRSGSENFLGYTGSIVGNIQKATDRRHFTDVRQYAHTIHRQVLESDMPLIPMWQLDPLIAVRKGRIEMPVLDPQSPFTRVAEWRVSGGR